MRTTDFNDATLYVLDDQPNWGAGFGISFLALSTSSGGLTGRDTRRALSVALRASCQFTLLLRGLAAARLENALRTLKDEKVAVPFWPALRKYSDAPRLVGGKVSLTYLPDWSAWQVFTGSDVPLLGSPLVQLVVPLMVGKLKNRETTWKTPTVVEMPVDFIEQSPIEQSLIVLDATLAAGPLPSDKYETAPALFPGKPNYQSPEVSFSALPATNDTIGVGREPVETNYLENPVRRQRTFHYANGIADIEKVVSFFTAHAAGKNFWAPTPNSVATITAPVSVSDTTVYLSSTIGFSVGDWAAFTRGEEIRFGKVVDKTINSILLDAYPGAIGPGWTVSRLMLGRLNAPKLDLTFRKPDFAECSLDVRDSATEYDPAAEESLGLSIGYLWHRVVLIELYQNRGGVVVTERFANHEDDVEWGGNIYTGGRAGTRMETGDRETSVTISRDSMSLTADLEASSLLQAIVKRRSFGPVYLRVIATSIQALAEFNEDFNEDYQK